MCNVSITFYRRKNMHAEQKTFAKRQSGFALIIALSMMAFVMLLLISTTLLIQVETVNASRALDQLRARENARLGLMLGLGNLQRYAGPDQRVTFSAAAYSTNDVPVQNPNWVGVVDTRSPTKDVDQIHWLVSNDALSPQLPTEQLPDSTSRVLAGLKLNNTEVRAPLQNIEGNANRYAYWVSDESAKASLATRPDLDAQAEDWLATSFGAAQAQRLDQVIPKRSGIEVLFSPTTSDRDVIFNQLSKVNSVSQTALMGAWEFTNYEDYIHAVTDRSYGLLASTTGTGLRSDISLRPDEIPIAGAFEEIEDFEQYMEPPLAELDESRPYIPYVDDLRRRYYITAPKVSVEGEISDGIAPVLTDFKLLFVITNSDNSKIVAKTSSSIAPVARANELVVGLQLSVELWNPYTSALVPEDLVLEIQNLPNLQIGLLDGGVSEGIINLELNDIDYGSSTKPGIYIELPFEERPAANNHDDVSWLPGRIYNWAGPNNYAGIDSTKQSIKAKFYSRSLSRNQWYTSTKTLIDTKIDQLTVAALDNNLTINLRRLADDGSVSTGDILSTYDVKFDPFNTIKNKSSKAVLFGYQTQRFESGHLISEDPWEKSTWLRNIDPRTYNPSLDYGGNNSAALTFPQGLDPTAYTSTRVKNYTHLFDRAASYNASSGISSGEDVPLFELFRQRPLSIGELQHLKISGRRPFTIGNSWGSQNGDRYNRVFDEAFFSGLKKEDTEPAFELGAALPNHRLRSVSGIAGTTANTLADLTSSNRTPELLVIEGAFNLNSTSSAAWAATLGSIQLPDWEIANIENANGELNINRPTETVNLGQTILRFPQSAQEVYKTLRPVNPYSFEEHPPTEYFRVGAKSSNNAANPMSYTDLGKQIALRVAQRIQLLGPFTSIESFLSPVEHTDFAHPQDPAQYLSVIERAILDVPEINQSAGEDIWYHTSSFLSQADVMTALAPIASVRGDTFTIRALGQTDLDISGESVATAICEARVQRLPTTVDLNDSVQTPDPDGYGRRFVITSIKWLNDQ